jgi:hypothetical protein
MDLRLFNIASDNIKKAELKHSSFITLGSRIALKSNG